ncbi:tetratricopeptide repeat protein [Castellaniella sp. FW104-16D08]|uniref:tetratricopeptide repeat protein n=1 Tax=unclassified Castellaniella TaxID=2617606 RepID=UPI003314EA32
MTSTPATTRIVSPWLLGALAIFLAVFLYIVKPGTSQLIAKIAAEPLSPLSVSYLEAWLRAEPDSPRFQALLSSQYLKLGRWDDAVQVASQIESNADPVIRFASVRLQAQALEGKAFEAPADSPQRQARIAQLSQFLGRLTDENLDIETLKLLAGVARDAGARDASRQFYQQLTRQDAAGAVHWYSALGAMALADGQYTEAADAYFQAQALVQSVVDRRQYFLAAVQSLQSGNLVALACEQAQQHVGDLDSDLPTLRYLIRLAESANRYDLVILYGRKMAKQLAFVPRFADGLLGAVHGGWQPPAHTVRVATKQDSALPSQAPGSDFELLYHAFMASGSLQDAIEIVQRALAKPEADRSVWLQRLAELSDWTGHTQMSLESWLALAREFNDPRAWNRLLVLAPQLDEDQIYLQALLHAGRGDLPHVQEIIQTYERLGNPEAAMAYLEQQLKGKGNRHLLELLAELSGRAGHDALSLASWKQLNTHYGPNPAYALHIATQLYMHRQAKEALAVLQEAQPVALQKGATQGFWKSYIDLARLLGQGNLVDGQVWAKLLKHAPDAQTFDSMLYFYYGSPIDVGRIAEVAYRQTHDIAYLQQAMEAYATARAWPRIQLLLQQLSSRDQEALEQSPKALEARGNYWLVTGKIDLGLKDLARAYQLPEGAGQVGEAYLWALLSFGDRASVRRISRQLAQAHPQDPAYARVLAAAVLQLGEPRRALRYLDLAGIPARQDPLWLMVYADAREALGQQGFARRIRRHAWYLLVRAHPFDEDSLDRSSARVVLGQMYLGGDASLLLLKRMVHRDPYAELDNAIAGSVLGNIPGVPSLNQVGSKAIGADASAGWSDPNTVPLVLGWALAGEHYALARAWLGKRYLTELQKPDSVQLALALQDHDEVQIATILGRDSATLSPDAKVQALDSLDRIASAQTVAFEAYSQASESAIWAETWRDVGLKYRPSAGVLADSAQVDDLSWRTLDLDAGLALSPHLALKVRRTDRWYSIRNNQRLGWVPEHDRASRLALSRDDASHHAEVEVGWRQAYQSFATLRASTEWVLSPEWRLALDAGLNQRTELTSLLAVAGRQTAGSAALSWDSQRNFFVQTKVSYARYNLQDGERLGASLGYDTSVGYHVRLGGPPISFQLQYSDWHYSSEDTLLPVLSAFMADQTVPTAADIMPSSTRQYGLSLQVGGGGLREQYRSGWQPFFDLSWLHDKRQGWGLGVAGGMSSPVLGRDRLGLFVTHEPARQGDGQASTQVGLYYRVFY